MGGLALVSLALTGVRSGCHRGHPAHRAQLRALESALAMYRVDTRRYPRVAEGAFADDPAALYAALANPPQAGGGPQGPYADFSHPDWVGLRRATGEARPLRPDEARRLDQASFRRQHAPGAEEALVFLDPWGGVVHYREWESLGERARQVEPRAVSLPDGLGGRHLVRDAPHDPETFDLWSAGPNGLDERGAACSDDLLAGRGLGPDSCSGVHGRVARRARPAEAGGLLWGALGLLALVGARTTLGWGAGRARALRAAASAWLWPPVPVRVHARRAPVRCAYCHGVGGALAACGCGAALHPACWALAAACPTLGCAARAPAAEATPRP